MKHKIKRYLPLIALIAVMVAAYFSGITEYLGLENIQAQKSQLLEMKEANFAAFSLIFIIIYAFSVALSLPIATVLTLLAGFLFGTFVGTLFVVTGATAGAVVIFLIAQSSLGVTLREKAKGIYKKVEHKFKEDAVSYLLFMRLVPVFPFVLVNIVPALFNIRLRTYVWTTFVGIIPGSFVYANIGTALGEINSLSGLVSLQTIGAFVLLGVFSLLPMIIKKLKKKSS